MSLKRRIFNTLEIGEGFDKLSKRFDIFLMTMILLNAAAVILDTVENLHIRFRQFFIYFEYFSVFIFTVEYLGRVWTCTYMRKYRNPVTGRLKFIFSFLPFIDLLAILPFYIPFLIAVDARVLRMLRLFRIVRIFKMGRYSTAFNMITRVITKRREELLVTLTIVFVMLILASSMMFFVEHEAQPDKFSSIPATMWWGVATITTVGYGDVYPITPLGRVLGAFIAVLGVGIFALPAGIIATGFDAEIKEKLRNGEKEEEEVTILSPFEVDQEEDEIND